MNDSNLANNYKDSWPFFFFTYQGLWEYHIFILFSFSMILEWQTYCFITVYPVLQVDKSDVTIFGI